MKSKVEFSKKDFEDMMELMNQRLIKKNELKRLDEKISCYEKRQAENFRQRCPDKLHS